MDGQCEIHASHMWGQVAANTNIWRKGLVYTRRVPETPGYCTEPYRVAATFKCRTELLSSKAGFAGLYHRVRTIANRAILGKARSVAGPPEDPIISCHGWRRFGEVNEMACAFIMLELRCSSDCGGTKGLSEPTKEDFLSPGGTSLEELARLMSQCANEVFNEFDFAEESAALPDPVTVSYGERTSDSGSLDFEPFVRRAEQIAENYNGFLKELGEVRSNFSVVRREWFLANSDFVTVHICFER